MVAIVISLSSFIASQLWAARGATVESVRSIEYRMREIETRLSECEKSREVLSRENIELMRQLFRPQG